MLDIQASRAMASALLESMVDIDLLVQQLRKRGHTVDHVIKVPANAGEYELTIDGELVNLAGAEEILANDQES